MTPAFIQYASGDELERLSEGEKLSHEQQEAIIKRLLELLKKAEDSWY